MSAGLKTVEIKAFVPVRDFALSKCLYQQLGFTMASDEDGVAFFHHGDSSLLPQDFYKAEHAENFTMHLQVQDVLAWWAHVQACGLIAYGVHTTPPQERPWAMIDFTLTDPSGVLWRIAQNIPRKP